MVFGIFYSNRENIGSLWENILSINVCTNVQWTIGTGNNLVWKFDHLLTVQFMIVKNFNIDNMNCDQNIENDNKQEQSINRNIVRSMYLYPYYSLLIYPWYLLVVWFLYPCIKNIHKWCYTTAPKISPCLLYQYVFFVFSSGHRN